MSVHRLAAWARRRGRLAQGILVAGSAVMAGALLATLSGTSTFALGVVLALAIVAVGLGFAWVVQRAMPRVRLEIGERAVVYDAMTHRIQAAWDDVVAVDLVLRGSETGPALVLRADRSVGGGGLLGLADLGGIIDGSAIRGPSMRSTIPLAAFIQGPFRGSPVEADLRRHIPELVDAYLARYPDRGR